MMRECYRCGEKTQLVLYYPPWGEKRPVCIEFLRRLGNGVDTRSWLLAGYAGFDDPRGAFYPRILRIPEEKQVRRDLDEDMGWSEELPLEAPSLFDEVEAGDHLRIQYIGAAGGEWRDVRVVDVRQDTSLDPEGRTSIEATVINHPRRLTIYACDDDAEKLFVDDEDYIGQSLEEVVRIDAGDSGGPEGGELEEMDEPQHVHGVVIDPETIRELLAEGIVTVQEDDADIHLMYESIPRTQALEGR